MPLIKFGIHFILTWSDKYMLSNATALVTTFAIIDTKFYVPAVVLLNQDNAKLLQQLRSGFKRITT